LNCKTGILRHIFQFRALKTINLKNQTCTGSLEESMGKRSTQNGENSATADEKTMKKTVEEDSPEVDEASQADSEQEETAQDNAENIASEDESGGDDQTVEEAEKEPETIEELEARYKDELAGKDDKYIRLVAEFDNFKKRSTQEMQTRFKFASQQLGLNIISGLDNLERALVQAQEEENEQLKEFVRGVEMVQQQLYDALKHNNIERFYPKGELFDPNQHEAMGVVETEEVEPDHVAEVFQAGYIMHDRVIRPAMVQVAKKK
jgi:molecular chaperone GrpE